MLWSVMFEVYILHLRYTILCGVDFVLSKNPLNHFFDFCFAIVSFFFKYVLVSGLCTFLRGITLLVPFFYSFVLFYIYSIKWSSCELVKRVKLKAAVMLSRVTCLTSSHKTTARWWPVTTGVKTVLTLPGKTIKNLNYSLPPACLWHTIITKKLSRLS